MGNPLTWSLAEIFSQFGAEQKPRPAKAGSTFRVPGSGFEIQTLNPEL
jgi:hypothetical protein